MHRANLAHGLLQPVTEENGHVRGRPKPGGSRRFLLPGTQGGPPAPLVPCTIEERVHRMLKREHGFTLIELMIVVAIIGILASLAVSAYQTYTVRAQVSEALSFAGGAKVPIVDAFTNDGVAPLDRQAAGMSPNPTDTQGSYVASVAITDGRIDILFGNDAHQAISGTTLSVTPYIPTTGGATVNWRCGYGPAPAGTQLMPADGGTAVHQTGSIESRYLPASCRP